MAVVLSLGDLSSCGAGVACNFGGLLVVCHNISICDWVFGFCFHPWGSRGFSWVMRFGTFALGAPSDGVGCFPLLNTYMCPTLISVMTLTCRIHSSNDDNDDDDITPPMRFLGSCDQKTFHVRRIGTYLRCSLLHQNSVKIGLRELCSWHKIV